MSHRLNIIGALVAITAASPSFADIFNPSPLSDVFHDIYGTASINSLYDNQTQELQFGPSAVNSGDKVNASVLIYQTFMTRHGQYFQDEAGLIEVESNYRGALEISTEILPTFYPSKFMPAVAIATWTGTLQNTFSDTRNFELASVKLGNPAATKVTVNGSEVVTTSSNGPFSWYSLGTLSPGASATVSYQLETDLGVQWNFDARATLAGYASNPVTPVPEPATSALFVAGLGAVGLLARRRQARAITGRKATPV